MGFMGFLYQVIDSDVLTPATPGSTHIHFASLQNATCSLPENLQGPNDSNTVSKKEQGSSVLCSPTDDLLRLRKICASTKNVQGSSSLMEDPVGSNASDELKVHCDLSSCRENQQWSKIFDSQTEDFQGSNENRPLSEQGGNLEGSIGFYPFGEDQDGSGDFSPFTYKQQISGDFDFSDSAPEGREESLYYSLGEDKQESMTMVPPTDELLQHEKTLYDNDLLIPRTFHCSETLRIEGLQRSPTFDEEVTQRSENSHSGDLQRSKNFRAEILRKSMDDENATPSMPSMSDGTNRTITLPSACIKDRKLSKSSGTNVFAHKTPSLMRLITKTYLRIVILLVFISKSASEDVHLDCTSKEHLTSTNYPFDYPNDANMRWHVTAPPGRWILVDFNDFSLEDTSDFLELLDIADIRNTERYTGERTRIPSYLTQGNAMDATFASYGIATRRGFNLTVSCYEKSDTNRGRLVGGNTPEEGFLELQSESGEWVSVCEENLSPSLAEVICGELGYPGVQKISYTADGCQSHANNRPCVKAPSCGDDTYLLQDCSFTPGNCITLSSVIIKCNEPGYIGCYEFEVNQLQNGSSCNSVPQCVSSCRREKQQAIAIVNRDECFCSTASKVNLQGRKLAKDQTCINKAEHNQQNVNASVYNVSVGFCNQTDDVKNGSWNSTITWFGSIIHLTCDEGYSVNGNETLQCVPGVSLFLPVWNDSMPTCEEDSTSSTSDTKNSTSNTGEDDCKEGICGSYPYIMVTLVMIFIIFITATTFVISRKRNDRIHLPVSLKICP